MPVSRYNKGYLLKCLGFKISDDELARNVDNMGLNVEEMDKGELTLEFQANRPDLVSTVGLARSLRYFMRRSRDFKYQVKPPGENEVIKVGAHVEAIRPYIAALIVRKMKLQEEQLRDIINFTERVSENYGRHREKIAMGMHDLRNVKAPFFYDAYEDEEYVPLNRNKPVRFSSVVKMEEKGKRYGQLGAAEARFVALKDTKGTMSLIPVLNSERTKVTLGTESMLVDVTGKSKEVINRIVDMLAADFIDMGFEVSQVQVSYGAKSVTLPAMERKEYQIPLTQVNEEIGVNVGFNNVILLANKMGYEAALLGRNIRFTTPPYRLDIINEQDIVEDVAVAYGYDYIQPIAVPATQQGSLEQRSRTFHKMSSAMVGLGFSEAMNSYLTNESVNFKKMRLEPGKDYITIENPKAETISMLRSWLLPSLMRNLGMSMHDKLPIRLYELDMCFAIAGGLPDERHHLAGVVCHSQANFNEAKAAVSGFMKKLGIACDFKKAEHASFIEGRCASIMLDKRNIGFMGEIHPEVLTSFGIEEPVVGFEIDLGTMS